ncbi:hypothetical protein M5D96_009391 [Drosophila gunungcola]|uniref:Kazal-like domain-containing protein n=1 Tax=Drosophila gunungcola TaxID=103775 RepID=A0A9P9YJF1_9MUSC|nr:hypothetical protein M5D96_009391 [Drosophila gunungcola]
MKVILVLAILSLGQAAELPQTTTGKPQQTELPVHIQNMITSHVNQVLQHIKNKPQVPSTLTGPVDWSGSGVGVGVVVARQWSNPIQISFHHWHTLVMSLPLPLPTSQRLHLRCNLAYNRCKLAIHRPVVHNKVVMPPVEQVVHSPIDVAEKLNKLQLHVTKVMQQAEKHIPLAVNQAIKQKQEQQAQKEKEQLQKDKENHKDQVHSDTTPHPNAAKTGRSLVIPDKVSNIVNLVHAHIPQLISQHREEMKLGKCNFQCPKAALSVCASNGKCVVNFPGQCELTQWNCFNTKNVFHQVHDAECQNTITCYQRDMM